MFMASFQFAVRTRVRARLAASACIFAGPRARPSISARSTRAKGPFGRCRPTIYTLRMLNSFLKQSIAFVRAEPMPCIAFACAAVSCAFVPAGHDFFASIDMRVLGLLFCLMAAVDGLRSAGVFSRCAHLLIEKTHGLRALSFALVALPFFASMLVTNDVALLAFVPFAIVSLSAAKATHHLPRVVVLQAVAANIGGMVTPMGNPQNLFLYTTFGLPLPAFLATLLPFAAATLAALGAACLRLKGEIDAPKTPFGTQPLERRKAAVYGAFFLLCLAAVMRIIPYQALFALTLVSLLAFDRATLKRIDYGLLATFVCFFVFSGNIASIPAIANALAAMMEAAPFFASAAISQAISNVPAAVLLAPFAGDWQPLLLGVDLGGLGTPIASLASLIALRLYLHTPDADFGRVMKEFAVINAFGLAGLVGLYCAMSGMGVL